MCVRRQEVKKERKKIEKVAIKNSFRDRSGNNHHKWVWDMFNKHGKIVTCQVTVSKSPSDWRWKKQHHGTLRKIFRDLEIEGYRIE